MKAIVIFAAVLAVATAQRFAVNRPPVLRQQQVIRPGQEIPILRQAADVNPDGSYQYQYETGNGIAAGEQGVGGQSVQGTAQWTAPDGTPVSIQYTADENGYRAEGSHVPATPEYVARALQYIAAHPYNEEAELRRQEQRLVSAVPALQIRGPSRQIAAPQRATAFRRFF